LGGKRKSAVPMIFKSTEEPTKADRDSPKKQQMVRLNVARETCLERNLFADGKKASQRGKVGLLLDDKGRAGSTFCGEKKTGGVSQRFFERKRDQEESKPSFTFQVRQDCF